MNARDVWELKEFFRQSNLEGGLTAYKLPEIEKRKHRKYTIDKDGPQFKSQDEIDLKFMISKINDPGTLAPRQKHVKNKSTLIKDQKDFMILRKDVNNMLSEEKPPPFVHPRKKIIPKQIPEVFMEPVDSPDVRY